MIITITRFTAMNYMNLITMIKTKQKSPFFRNSYNSNVETKAFTGKGHFHSACAFRDRKQKQRPCIQDRNRRNNKSTGLDTGGRIMTTSIP